MFAKPEFEENSIPVLAPFPWRVVNLEVLAGYLLKVRFMDELEGLVSLSPLIHSPGAGVFAALADPALFNQAFIDGGAPAWPGEIDLAPNTLYKEIQKNGIYTPPARPSISPF